MIREQENGQKTADVCRLHGISEATFYKYKAKYGGMDISDAKRLKALEDENARLKKLLADQMLDNAMLRNIPSKKDGKARRAARSRCSPDARAWGERTSGLFSPASGPVWCKISSSTHR